MEVKNSDIFIKWESKLFLRSVHKTDDIKKKLFDERFFIFRLNLQNVVED